MQRTDICPVFEELSKDDREARAFVLTELARMQLEWGVRKHVHANWDWVARELLASIARPASLPVASPAVGSAAVAPRPGSAAANGDERGRHGNGGGRGEDH